MPPSTVLCCFTLVIPSACLPIKSGLPARILSSREIRLTAPDFVLGGKNSREKNLSLLSHLGNNDNHFQTQVDIFFPIPPSIDLLCKGGSKTVHVDWGGWSGAVDKGNGSRKEGKKEISIEGESCWISISAVSKLQPMERKSEVGETGKGSWVKHPIGGLNPHFLLWNRSHLSKMRWFSSVFCSSASCEVDSSQIRLNKEQLIACKCVILTILLYSVGNWWL